MKPGSHVRYPMCWMTLPPVSRSAWSMILIRWGVSFRMPISVSVPIHWKKPWPMCFLLSIINSWSKVIPCTSWNHTSMHAARMLMEKKCCHILVACILIKISGNSAGRYSERKCANVWDWMICWKEQWRMQSLFSRKYGNSMDIPCRILHWRPCRGFMFAVRFMHRVPKVNMHLLFAPMAILDRDVTGRTNSNVWLHWRVWGLFVWTMTCMVGENPPCR